MADVIRGRHADSLEPLQLVPLPAELEPMQAAINRLLAQIEDLLHREHRFIADAAHEMRTLLAILRLHAQNAQAAIHDAERQKALGYLIGGVDRLTRVVNQLLTLARVQPRFGQVGGAEVDLAEVVTETLAELTPWILDHGLEPSLEIGEGDHHLTVDAGALAIALQNLISNAVEHSPSGGRITVSLKRLDKRFELVVEDEGPGIEDATLSRVFERFYSRNNPNGAGLGLAIVAAIMGRMGGQVRLGNRSGGGLSATLSMPLPG